MAKDYKALKREWYNRLKKSGFVDIEEERGGETYLKQNSANAYRGADALTREAKELYFTRLCQLVSATKFPSPIDALVMEQYANGLKYKDTQLALIAAKTPRRRETIWRIRTRWLKEWGLK